MKSLITVIVMLFTSFSTFAADIVLTPAQAKYIQALRIKESGGEPNGGRDAVGDGGKALGPLQIWRVYWIDARMTGTYEQCKDLAYATQVVARYAMRYEPAAWRDCNIEVLARLHNGGPGWAKKREKTDAYWAKFKAIHAGLK